MDAEKAAILDEVLDLNRRTIALAERAERYVFGRVLYQNSFCEPVTGAIADMAKHVVLAPDKDGA